MLDYVQSAQVLEDPAEAAEVIEVRNTSGYFSTLRLKTAISYGRVYFEVKVNAFTRVQVSGGGGMK